ncbi:MAG: 2-amino-4-hydroxy-6-hydroxymethyldihydropteridine diphosphokinase [Bacteroidetes bacterium GWF2_42_66]|nr:MAG: 2-amino-4-hydroxy-6-hydroxymethyldihydropteridine diphosphokinase [Bacteroidetes bacterium GWE2_42_39]OFY42792.1 MAG: 2-amino-4-hydroxy-6-hydroxymethyldihydropteridine diphosphokinase [Bacteroidetes bacterium GWF2_42_66]HBL74412.1 2-amino-4-hydroxy-6-hydroxymethyldihydropteridine diphosphokinase [Prolixibacteraceae bacterium]HCR90441.1 2-amino-4-hydroxy-6-hydroxymethyldihydropteridine diphosphokinase [Prolixibacteraceae bacterium]HCU61894.1 2-amino-4-hydroxy-6-hydroxymethyldihydropterid
MNRCIIGVGSNIDAEENIRRALEILGNDFPVLGISEMIKTEPIGIKNQAEFTNGAVKIETTLQEDELLHYLKKLEDQLGRDRSLPKFGPRTIDLDIVIWNDQVVDSDYYERDFLRKSCAELGFKIR